MIGIQRALSVPEHPSSSARVSMGGTCELHFDLDQKQENRLWQAFPLPLLAN